MDSDSELQIASADLAFNQSTDPGPGDSVIFSDYLPRSLVRILDLGYTLESPSELIKRGLGVSQKPPGDHRAQLGWRWRCCHLPRLHRSHPRCPSCWPSFITGGGHGLGSSSTEHYHCHCPEQMNTWGPHNRAFSFSTFSSPKTYSSTPFHSRQEGDVSAQLLRCFNSASTDSYFVLFRSPQLSSLCSLIHLGTGRPLVH